MNKKQKSVRVFYNFGWEYITIDKLKQDIQALEALGATKIAIECDGGHVDITAYTVREETDEECIQRELMEHTRKKQQEERDLREYNRLKALFENK